MINRTINYTKQHAPESVRLVARRAMLDGHNAKLRLTVPVVSRCGFANVYHCAMRKTASQWITAVFSDPIVYRYSGLLPYVPRYYKWAHPQKFPEGRTALNLFLSHERFMTIPKPDPYRAFFVVRDPRDILISSYFSTRNTHAPMGDVIEARKVLLEKSEREGILYMIRRFTRKKTFEALRSWADTPDKDSIRIFRYEDLTGKQQPEFLDQLMRHCGIVIPPDELATLVDRYSFERMRTAKAATGSSAHYRKGTAGDWRNYFDEDVDKAFRKATGDLAQLFGYPKR